MITTVVAPLHQEIAALGRRLTNPSRCRIRGLRWARVGTLRGEPLLLAVTGDGEARARSGIASLLGAQPCGRLIAIGVAGGLSPELAAGALVAAGRVWREDGTILTGDAGLLESLARAGARPGIALTARELAATPGTKASLLASLSGAGPTPPAVVDLESAFYAQAAEEAGVPWAVVRAVSDTAEEALPPFLERCRDGGGGVRRSAVVRYAIAHLGVVPELLHLERRVRLCAEELASCVENLVGPLGAAPSQTPNPNLEAPR